MLRKNTAKHRALSVHSRSDLRSGHPVRTGLRHAAIAAAVAVGATGVAVLGAVHGDTPVTGDRAAAALVANTGSEGTRGLTQAELDQRTERASRSSDERRPIADRQKAQALSNDSGRAVSGSEDLSKADPKTLARTLMPQYGLSQAEFGCLDDLWTGESGWNVHADNPTSSAYGIPQALPGSKMASAGPNWQSNPETQIRWGLGYIKDRFGSACSAQSFKQSAGWY